MESAHRAPIVASGSREAAGRVIGVSPCGSSPVCHDGRSVSWQGSGKVFQHRSGLGGRSGNWLPGMVSSRVQALDWRATTVSSRSSCATERRLTRQSAGRCAIKPRSAGYFYVEAVEKVLTSNFATMTKKSACQNEPCSTIGTSVGVSVLHKIVKLRKQGLFLHPR